MENTSSEMNGKLEDHQDSLSHSYSCDGYERLHDEAMEKISVSIHYSDLEESLSGNSRNSLTKANENQEKKMKISLSQEQLRLKNFLSVPKITKKSASFSASDEKDGRNLVKIDLEVPAEGPKNIISSVSSSASQNVIVTSANAESDSGEYDEIIYAVPRKNSTRVLRREITLKTSSASSSPSKSVTIAQTSSAFALDGNYKYPLSFYCKICNNILNDPRTLDCLHSFCVQCLARLDVTNDLQNNQFWRKISDSSCECLGGVCDILKQEFCKTKIFFCYFDMVRSNKFSLSPSLISDQAPSVSSVLSSYESDKSQKAKFSISGSVKNRRFFKDKAS